jgi:hypothetical protein
VKWNMANSALFCGMKIEIPVIMYQTWIPSCCNRVEVSLSPNWFFEKLHKTNWLWTWNFLKFFPLLLQNSLFDLWWKSNAPNMWFEPHATIDCLYFSWVLRVDAMLALLLWLSFYSACLFDE